MSIPLLQLEGKYEVLRKLHEGGMGDILLVRHRMLGEERVIKTMRPQLATDEQFRQRFLAEARAAAHLSHPHIAQVHDFNVDGAGNAYIVLEYIPGVSFKELLEVHGPPPLHLAMELASQAIGVLVFLHSRGKVHRDISPDNLMLRLNHEEQPWVKLIDLGIVKDMENQGVLTTTGHFLGKVRYSSPEHFGEMGAAGAEPRSDQYSFGLVLYELLTGRCAISGSDIASISAGHLYRAPLSFVESDPERRVPERLRQLVMKALAKRAEDRFSTTAELATQLAEIQAGVPRAEVDLPGLLAEVVRVREQNERTAGAATQARLDQQFGLETTPGAERSSTTTLESRDLRTLAAESVGDLAAADLSTGATVAITGTEMQRSLDDRGTLAVDLPPTRPTVDPGAQPPAEVSSLDDAPSEATVRLSASALEDIRSSINPAAEIQNPVEPGTMILGDIRGLTAQAHEHQSSEGADFEPSLDDLGTPTSTLKLPTLGSSSPRPGERRQPPASHSSPPRDHTAPLPTLADDSIRVAEPWSDGFDRGAPPSFAEEPEMVDAASPSRASEHEPTEELHQPDPKTLGREENEAAAHPEILPIPEGSADVPAAPPAGSDSDPLSMVELRSTAPVEAVSKDGQVVVSNDGQVTGDEAPDSNAEERSLTETSVWASPPPAQAPWHQELMARCKSSLVEGRAALAQMVNALGSESRELWQALSPQLARYRVAILITLGCLFCLAALLVLVGRGTHEPESEMVAESTISEELPPPPEPVPEDLPLHPEVEHLQGCWDWRDLSCVDEQLARIEEGNLTLSVRESELVDSIRQDFESSEARPAEDEEVDELGEGLLPQDVETLTALLVRGLEEGVVKDLRSGVEGFFVLRKEDPDVVPEELRPSYEKGHEILRHYYALWTARNRTKKPLVVIENASWLLENYPLYTRPTQLREAAALEFERDSRDQLEDGDLPAALAILRQLEAVWPDRPGLVEKIGDIETRQTRNAAIRETLAEVRDTLEANPESGLEILKTLTVPPAYSNEVTLLRQELERSLRRLDLNTPALVRVDSVPTSYRKKDPAILEVNIDDDYGVVAARAFVRIDGEARFSASRFPLQKKGASTYRLEIPAAEHGGAKKIEVYMEADDRSGHTGSLGSRREPIVLERKGALRRMFSGDS